MRLSTLLLTTGALCGAAFAYWSGHCQQQAELGLRVLSARLEPVGQLRYQELRAWPWGRGRVTGVSLRLSAPAASRLGLANGAVLRAERVDLLDFHALDDSTPTALKLSWTGLRWPLPEATVAPEPGSLRPSRRREPGPAELRINGDLHLQYLPSERSLRLRIDARSPMLAAVDSELSLRAGPEAFLGRFDDVELIGARFDYRDLGLLAQRRGSTLLSAPVAGSVGAERLWDRVEQHLTTPNTLHWTDGDERRLRDFLREPTALRLVLAPPGRLQLRDLPMYASVDLPQVLGVELSLPATGSGP